MSFLNSIKQFFLRNFKIGITGTNESLESEFKCSFVTLAKLKGYQVEEHTVATEDGYKLELYRIMGKFNQKSTEKTQAVFFQHGLLDSSDAWICNYEKYCLPFILNNKGFDVWIGNSRGNKYSRNHTSLDPAEEEFWKFSFHEMGIYDTPACLNYILDINKNSKKVIYFGHSQGGASLLAGMCEKYNFYQEKLLVAVLLAPASRVDSIDSNLLHFLKNIDIDDKLKEKHIHEIFPFDPDMIDLNIKIAKVYPTMSNALLEMTSDENSWVNCPDRTKVYFSHYPSGTSLQSITHFKQLIASKKFQKFDYGKDENLRIYGSQTPPEYNLSIIKDIPIILCGGLNDKLTHINDIRWLKSQIEGINTRFFSYYEFEHMGHASFMLNSNITWFNFVLHDIYKVIKMDLGNNWVKVNEIKQSDEKKQIFKVTEYRTEDNIIREKNDVYK